MLRVAVLSIWSAGAISLMLALCAWRRRRAMPSAAWMAALMGGVSVWSLAYAVSLELHSPAAIHWIDSVAYIGVATVPVCLLGFAVSHAGKGHLLTRGRLISLFLIPAGVVGLVATNSRHLLFYSHVRLGEYGGFTHQVLTPGALWWLHLGYSYLCVGTAVTLLAWLLFRVRGMDRKRIGYILAGAALSFPVNIIYVLGFKPGGFLDLTPVGFVAMGLLMFHGVFRVGLFDVFPHALDALFKQLQDALFVLDRQCRIVNANPTGVRLLSDPEFQRDCVEGAPNAHRIPGPGIAESDGEQDVNLREQTWQLRTLTLQTDAKEITGYLVMLQDVTRRKRAEEELRLAKEQAEAATRTKSEFLANMSHEIRTPMNAIIGFAHLVLRTELTPKQTGYLTTIDFAARSLLGIINDILDFSKIEAGKMVLEHEPFSLRDVMDNLVSMVGLTAREKKISLDVAVEPDTPDHFLGDSLRLGQVLINLTGNAVKFTKQGGVRVHVRALRKQCPHGSQPNDEPENVELLFTIRDTGIGIEPDKLSSLFQPFRQADTSTTRYYGGTGLGLPISKQFVEMMGGTIQVESQSGKGSTFSFTVRLELADRSVIDQKQMLSAEQLRPGDVALSHLAGRRVLLVEDNALNIDLAVELLTELGISVEVAVNGREGVRLATNEPFDLILMDVQMPEMDGYEATRQIRKQKAQGSGQWREIPIVAMTAHAMAGDREKSLAAGMDDHLTKPIDPDMLRNALLRWIPVPREQKTEGGTPKTEIRSRKSEVGRQKTGDRSQESPSFRQPSTSSLQPAFPSSLPPFDIPAALARCNDNPELLRRLLLVFGNEYANAGKQIRDLFQAGNQAEALRRAHSLKGAAATVNALELTKAAGDVELALSTGRTDDLDALIRNLDAALAPAVNAAASLAEPQKTALPASCDIPEPIIASRPLSPDTFAVLEKLREQLMTNSMKACKSFSAIGEELLGRGVDDDVASLAASLKRLDYPDALESLKRIEAAVSQCSV